MQTSTQLKTSKRLSESLLSKDQQKAINFLFGNNGILYARMGAGKSAIAATAVKELLSDGYLTRVLIVTTPKIANTVWRQEFAKWEHLYRVPIEAATGTPEQRHNVITKQTSVNIVVVTFNALAWMKDNRLFSYFDGLLIDETTKLAETGGSGFKALRPALKHFKWRAGLTGTPVNESYEKLFGQCLLMDQGKALGTRKDLFLNDWFFPTDFKQYNWEIKPDKKTALFDKVKHLFHIMPDYRDELPEFNEHVIKLEMPEDLREKYEEMKKHSIVDNIVAQSEAITSQKLTQMVSGFLYDDDKNVTRYSFYRLNAMRDLVNKTDTNMLVFYWYQEDLALLKMYFPQAKTLTEENKKHWDQGNVKMLLAQPRSAAHGLQLEKGGHTIIWFSNQWSNDVWEQANARLWRKGQTNNVDCYVFETLDSIDEIINKRVESKQEFDKLFSEYLK